MAVETNFKNLDHVVTYQDWNTLVTLHADTANPTDPEPDECYLRKNTNPPHIKWWNDTTQQWVNVGEKTPQQTLDEIKPHPIVSEFKESVSLPVNGILDIPEIPPGKQGTLEVRDETNQIGTKYNCAYDNTTHLERLAGPSAHFSAVKNTADRINSYYENGNIKIQNKLAGTVLITVGFFGL
jgi:hypothetical protein